MKTGLKHYLLYSHAILETEPEPDRSCWSLYCTVYFAASWSGPNIFLAPAPKNVVKVRFPTFYKSLYVEI
jgi:hypothetical protein